LYESLKEFNRWILEIGKAPWIAYFIFSITAYIYLSKLLRVEKILDEMNSLRSTYIKSNFEITEKLRKNDDKLEELTDKFNEFEKKLSVLFPQEFSKQDIKAKVVKSKKL